MTPAERTELAQLEGHLRAVLDGDPDVRPLSELEYQRHSFLIRKRERASIRRLIDEVGYAGLAGHFNRTDTKAQKDE